MNNITRYDIDEYGELPVSWGRYVRWEDYYEVIKELYQEIEQLELQQRFNECNYSNGWDDGYEEGVQEGKKLGTQQVAKFREQVLEMAKTLEGE